MTKAGSCKMLTIIMTRCQETADPPCDPRSAWVNEHHTPAISTRTQQCTPKTSLFFNSIQYEIESMDLLLQLIQFHVQPHLQNS